MILGLSDVIPTSDGAGHGTGSAPFRASSELVSVSAVKIKNSANYNIMHKSSNRAINYANVEVLERNKLISQVKGQTYFSLLQLN